MEQRKLDGHKVNPANDILEVIVMDAEGAGGAHHHYQAYVDPNPGNEKGFKADIHFQNGPIGENGVNGLTHEALLEIVADRLRSFQKGPYSCKENACALTHIEEAQHWLQQRTIARMRRGVEGTHKA